jgi:hypothetical protein
LFYPFGILEIVAVFYMNIVGYKESEKTTKWLIIIAADETRG